MLLGGGSEDENEEGVYFGWKFPRALRLPVVGVAPLPSSELFPEGN